MAIEDAVARVANPKDVLDVGEQTCDPGIGQCRLRYLPADDSIRRLFMFFEHIHQIAVEQLGELLRDGHSVELAKIPIETAFPLDIASKDAASIIHLLGWN